MPALRSLRLVLSFASSFSVVVNADVGGAWLATSSLPCLAIAYEPSLLPALSLVVVFLLYGLLRPRSSSSSVGWSTSASSGMVCHADELAPGCCPDLSFNGSSPLNYLSIWLCEAEAATISTSSPLPSCRGAASASPSRGAAIYLLLSISFTDILISLRLY